MGWLGGCLDHSPIFLEIEDANLKPGSPFKFNVTSLRKDDFHVILRIVGLIVIGNPPPPPPLAMVISNNLARLKEKTITWVKAKQKREGEELTRI